MKSFEIPINAGNIFTYKDELEELLTQLKSLDKEFDDNLHQSLLKSADLIKFNKDFNEIKLIGKVLLDTFKENNINDSEVLLTNLRKKIYETQIFVLENVQKSMLKAVDALLETEKFIVILGNINEIVKTVEKIEIRRDEN